MRKVLFSLSIAVLAAASYDINSADSAVPFQFEALSTLDDMATHIREHFPLKSPRKDLRRAFVDEGRGTLKVNPNDASVEKYIYDINLCSYYVWRWNVSADYDADGRLLQAYVNGNIVFTDGKPKETIPKVAEEGKKASIIRAQRPRPEAFKGEKSLGFIIFDRDSDLKTIDDQAAIGAGPSRADPANLGKLYTYTDVDPWRSIFDSDSAERIVPYKGDCADADKRMQSTAP
jgi:hypothetical protein